MGIIDVHNHTPRYRVPPEVENTSMSALWRPDQSASTAHTWDQHVKALEGIERAIVFNIASDPRIGEPDIPPRIGSAASETQSRRSGKPSVLHRNQRPSKDNSHPSSPSRKIAPSRPTVTWLAHVAQHRLRPTRRAGGTMCG